MVKIQRLFAKTNLKIPVYLSGAILQQLSVSQNLKAHLRRFSHCRFRLVGKGLVRETLLPLPRLRGFGTHYETGPEFLLLFSIKSKEERLCFAERVLNGRSSYLHQAPFAQV